MTRPRPDLERAARAVDAFLQAVGAPTGEDPELSGTGERVAHAFADELLAGYAMDPAAILASRTTAALPGLVVVRDLPVATMCPHHLLPATGRAHVGYLPAGELVGLGALGKLVDCFARRLALQEALGQQVADALVTHLGALGAACILDLEPTCVTVRGGRRHGARAVTHAWAGRFREDGALRAELLASLP